MIPLRQALKSLAYIVKDTDADGSEPDWIACHVLKCGRASLALRREITDGEFAEMEKIAEKRAKGVPLSQVLGYTEFLGMKINVNQDVLCPRPETELLAEQGIEYLKGKKDARALDLCTGSGCIAIALSTFSSAKVTATDISEKALAVARENAKEHKADVKFVLSDLFGNIEGRFDIIVSNPPYIPTADIEGLDKEVKDHEPRLALDGGEDGLDIYRKISVEAGEHLKDGGLLLLECGIGQAREIVKMLEGYDCGIIKDLQGIERIVKAVKKSV